MTYKEMMEAAVRVQNKYDELNMLKQGSTWNGEQLMAGFVGDVGDLSKIIMAKNGYRSMDEVDEKLAHELSDCLWSILVLANHYGVDLEGQFVKNMQKLETRVSNKIRTIPV